MTSEIQDYASALQYLYGFADYERATPRALEGFRLASVATLLHAAGDPHLALTAVHIAGTKGKGSTAAMIGAVLQSAGYSVGFYSSPHLHTHRERYRLDGEPVSEEGFTATLKHLQPAIERVRAERSLTTFEVSTALAFELFRAAGVDWSVVETGMGGRLDSTNLIEPRLSVITNISKDHTDVLGTTLGEIAYEKAGIIKPGVPVVVASQPDEAREVILRRAEQVGAPAWYVPEHILTRDRSIDGVEGQSFTLDTSVTLGGESLHGRRVSLRMVGSHQVENALTAILACTLPGEPASRVGAAHLVDGLAHATWPGRFEVLPGPHPTVVLDGAHNPYSVLQLKQSLAEVIPGRRVTCVFGAGRGHDAAGMLRELAGYRLVLCQASHPRAMPARELAALAQEAGVEFHTADSVRAALEWAMRESNDEVVVVCGSLFVVAEAREALGLARAADPVTH